MTDDLTLSNAVPTEPLKAGATVEINGDGYKVLSVEATGNPILEKSAVEIIADEMPLEQADFRGMEQRAAGFALPSEAALEMWGKLVRGIIRKAKGLKEEDVVDLPEGETGKYIAYALDNHGRLSVGKGRGRRKTRLKPHQAALQRLTGQLFGVYLTSAFKAAQDVAKAEGTEAKQIDGTIVQKAQKWATDKAIELTARPVRAAAKAARKRGEASRLINAGIRPSNPRRAHAAA